MMTLVLALGVPILVFGGIVWLMLASLRWARNRDGSGQNAVGHALQELDRLVARPSIENIVEKEAEVRTVDDQHGGE